MKETRLFPEREESAHSEKSLMPAAFYRGRVSMKDEMDASFLSPQPSSFIPSSSPLVKAPFDISGSNGFLRFPTRAENGDPRMNADGLCRGSFASNRVHPRLVGVVSQGRLSLDWWHSGS